MTDAARDARYPVVPQALRMTLEALTPTKELRNVRVLKTMARIPRAEFVAKEYRPYAYEDIAIAIGESQTISPPFVVAYMTEALDPQPTDRVLEIGTGSGYQAAVLSCLVAEVYTIEIVKPLGRRAAETIKKLGYDNVFVKLGDGYKGWAEAGPFDKIIVTCSPEKIPQPLIDQLREGGKMLIPIG
ncbi:MAG: protein-L-isoaspartate(D-aspartate) O-methyltransferase [Thermoguttaceae bacterium]|nr:protein-L-isoaspartate(D-aspartate) O-methyltransferase [Thermoguttaceae bacterium]